MNTLGKTVTLHKGLVVTDIGPHPTANRVRICITDNGERHLILDRVIQELPVTYRRANLPKYIY